MKIKIWFMIMLMVLSIMPGVIGENEDASVTSASTDDTTEVTVDSVNNLIVRNKIKTIAECTRAVSKVYPRASKIRIAKFCKNHPLFAKVAADRPVVTEQVLTRAREEGVTPRIAVTKIREERIERVRELAKVEARPTFAKYDPKKAYKARVVTRAKLEKAKENYLKAKNRYEEAKKKFGEAQQKFTQAKKKLQECEDDDSEECEEVRARIQANAQDYLLRTADMILDAIAKLKEKVNAAEELSEEEAADALADLEESEFEIEDAKATIEAMDKNTSKDDVKEAAKIISNAWKKAQKHLRITSGKLVNSKVGTIVLRSKNLGIRLEKLLEKMEEVGKDTSGVESLVGEFHILLDEAEAYHDKSIEAFKDNDDAKTHEYAKEAYEKLRDAQKKLAEIMREINKQGASDLLKETTEEEANDVDDSDDVEDEEKTEIEADDSDEEDEEEAEDEIEDESDDNDDSTDMDDETDDSSDKTEDDDSEDTESDNTTEVDAE